MRGQGKWWRRRLSRSSKIYDATVRNATRAPKYEPKLPLNRSSRDFLDERGLALKIKESVNQDRRQIRWMKPIKQENKVFMKKPTTYQNAFKIWPFITTLSLYTPVQIRFYSVHRRVGDFI